MPSYISHAIMGEQLYNEVYQSDQHAKVELSKDELRGYSLGIDLSSLSKKVKTDPANSYTKDFLISMIVYIKENNLTENSSVMSLLYGHIAHYFLDSKTHPLIYYIEKGTESTSFISNHTLVEGYLDSYLVGQILSQDIMDVKPEYFSSFDLSNPEVIKLLNSTYGRIYDDYHIIKSYKAVIALFNLIEKGKQKSRMTKERLASLSRFKSYLQKNRLSTQEITNECHLTYTNPVTGEKHNESFMDLYYSSIDMTLEAIKKVNAYLYSGYPISLLDNVFTGLSYDTGIDCSLGKRMIHVRKRQKRRRFTNINGIDII